MSSKTESNDSSYSMGRRKHEILAPHKELWATKKYEWDTVLFREEHTNTKKSASKVRIQAICHII